MQDDVGTPLFAVRFFNGVFRTPIAGPPDCIGILFPGPGVDLYFVSYHKRGIESKAKMPDNSTGVIFILLQELLCARKSNLVNILFNLLPGHPDTGITDRDGLLFL